MHRPRHDPLGPYKIESHNAGTHLLTCPSQDPPSPYKIEALTHALQKKVFCYDRHYTSSYINVHTGNNALASHGQHRHA